MTNKTRMRMSKKAANLIHEYRDNVGFKTNSQAVESLVKHQSMMSSANAALQKQLNSKVEELYDANTKIEQTRNNLRLATSDNVDLQRENLRKREQVDNLEQSQIDQAERHDKQLEILKEKLKTRNEWLAIFAVSNVVGWGLAITALAGVMG